MVATYNFGSVYIYTHLHLWNSKFFNVFYLQNIHFDLSKLEKVLNS